MIADFYTRKLKVEFNDCYSNGKISYVALSRYLQDTAGLHADDSGYGIYEMTANNQSWVLTRFSIEIDDLPSLNEEITIKTWIRFVKGAFSDREYEVYLNGKIIARATSSWVVINFKKRKVESLILPTNEIIFIDKCATSAPNKRININLDFEKVFNLDVRFSALDMVQHVSNLKYIDWVFDNVDPSKILKSKLEKMSLNYIKELKLADSISILNNEEGNTQTIKIVKGADVTSFAAKLEWKR